MEERFKRLVSRFVQKNVLVVGDVMLDQYMWGRVSRISPEAPVPVVEVDKVSFTPGGAANVACNVASLGGRACLIGVVGDDEEGRRLRQLFADNGILTEGLLTDHERPTTLKNRIIAHSQQIVRVDRERKEAVNGPLSQLVLERLRRVLADSDILVVSDYAKGLLTPALLRSIIASARQAGKAVLVDPKGRDYSKYRGVTAIMPNKQEAGQAVNGDITDESSLISTGRTLLRQLECEAVLITRGEEGMSLFEKRGCITHLPTFSRTVYDVTGAGDTVIAALSLALAAGASFLESATLANHAAGIVVGKVGTATVTSRELKRVLNGRLVSGH